MITGNLTKINGDFQFTNKLKEYAINQQWVDEYSSWWELVSASTEGIGKLFYEHIANYNQNIKDIDTCGLHQLYSIAKQLNVEQIFSYDLAYPPELVELMNTVSTNRSFLLTSGYILDDNQLSTIYSDIGLNISAGLSGEITTNLIYDINYITGFLEPIISANLITNSNYSLDSAKSGIALAYQGFMDDVYYDPASEFNSDTSGEIIEYVTHTLRNIAIRASYQRETLKTIAQKHAMIGTTNAIEKLINEYILRSFTKKSNWRLYVEPSGYMRNGNLKPDSINAAYSFEQNLPSITDVNSYFNVQVTEYYDNTEYLNISAESPYNIVITGYTTGYLITSNIDISGNLITGQIVTDIPLYGPSGLVVSGGNNRFWESENLNDSILLSEHTSAEISAFYNNIGLTGNLSDYWNLQTDLWNTYSPSGLIRNAIISELTGTRTDAYSATVPSAVPVSGWSILPTSLSAIHWKYMGTTNGNVPPANIKATKYPTIATQPFIWNLVEKVYEEFPDIIKTLLRSEQSDASVLSAQIDPYGNLIDSWKYFNHEFIGYQTYYEESNNLDFNEKMNSDIDRDGPFHVDALSAYILGNDMNSYYSQIAKDFQLTGNMNVPIINDQLIEFYNDIIILKNKVIYQYGYDKYDNHYMLYKDSEDITVPGRLWMRYRNHPLPFPVAFSKNSIDTSNNYKLQQMYVRENSIYGLGYMMENATYDFGFYDSVGWILGKNDKGEDTIIVYVPDYAYFASPKNNYLYTVIVDNSIGILPRTVNIGSVDNFVGQYEYSNYIIFVYLVGWNITKDDDNRISYSAQFKFKHYNKNTYDFENANMEDVQIYGLPAIQYGYDYDVNTLEAIKLPNVTFSNVWRLAVSEKLVTIAYEARNDDSNEFVNSIVTIDIKKDTLSSASNDVAIVNWNTVLES